MAPRSSAASGNNVTGSDTIFAVATGAGRAALTVLRLSGPATGQILTDLCRSRPAPREARLRSLCAADGEILDRALVLWFPSPGSYTGEDSGELHLHGGPAILADVAEALVQLGGRPAEPGEFTRRAFLNGRLDLVKAEAVADLVEAETSAQRRQALRQLDGSLGRLYEGWSARLTRLMAHQEAAIDFVDGEIPAEVEARAAEAITSLRQEIATHLNDGGRGERLRSGLLVAITGPPNVGKSTLFNALAERDLAIVAATPGTTRDALEARLIVADAPVMLIDTAGIRETDDPVEAEGVRRARAQAIRADIILAVYDATDMPAIGQEGPSVLNVANKFDLCHSRTDWALPVSARSGEGMAALRTRLADMVRRLTAQQGPPPLTRARHRAALSEALGRLDAAASAPLPELRAEDLRMALRSVGRITGRVGIDDLLDVIFSEFCIGK